LCILCSISVAAMPVCTKCKQTSPQKCVRQLCGACCVPPCAADVHNNRHSKRGIEGKNRRAKHSKFWNVAQDLAARWLDGSMLRRWEPFYKLDYFATRAIFLRAIKALVVDPHIENLDTQHPIVSAVCPPGEMERMIARLRRQFPYEEVIAADDEQLELRDIEFANDASCAASSSSEHGKKVGYDERIPASSDGVVPWRAHYDDDLPRRVVDVPKTTYLDDAAFNFVLPEWEPKNKPATTADKCPCAHYRRTHPLLYSQQSKAQRPRMVDLPRASTYMMAEAIFDRWSEKRRGLQEVFQKPLVTKFPWPPNEGEKENALLHSEGLWLWCKLKEWIPPPPAGTNKDEKSWNGQQFDTAIHSCSMYSVHRAIRNGLQPGPEVGKGGKRAVYAYRPKGNKAARSSSGYAVYSDLANNGLYFSPRFEVAIQLWTAGRADVGKIAVGEGQLALQPGMFHITGLWIHVLSGDDINSGMFTWANLDDWDPQYELDPTDSVD
jgi:hypothetical protein